MKRKPKDDVRENISHETFSVICMRMVEANYFYKENFNWPYTVSKAWEIVTISVKQHSMERYIYSCFYMTFPLFDLNI